MARIAQLCLALLVGSLFFLGMNHIMRVGEGAPAEPVPPTGPDDKCPRMRTSRLATQYLETLHGIEIGASTQNSFGLKRSINVDFSDEQGGLWQDKACAPAIVNVVANGDDLPFKDNTLDYVLASHVIEHFFDPVKALREWHRVIRPGGYVFVIAPHMDRMFDQYREPTPVQELLERNAGRLSFSDYARPLSPAALVKFGKGKLDPQDYPQRLIRDKGAPLEEGWVWYDQNDHHHWSAWRTADFVELVKALGYKIVEIQDYDDKIGNGFTVVIRKPWSGLQPGAAVSRP
ncbi:MAG: class I SAM-dependent methyltransferase [Betaproteobacteria bacterium]